MSKLSLVIVIVNNGYSDLVMELARKEGARGGTILNAMGSVRPEAEKLYGISVNPEKEMIMITVSNDCVDGILSTIYKNAGATTEAQGIAFTLPIDDATSNLKNQYTKEEE